MNEFYSPTRLMHYSSCKRKSLRAFIYVNTCRKSWHSTANRGAETDVFCSAWHRLHALSEFAVPRKAAPVPKY